RLTAAFTVIRRSLMGPYRPWETHLRRAASGRGPSLRPVLRSLADVVAELAFLASPAPPSGGIARGGRVAAYPAERKRQSGEKEFDDMSTSAGSTSRGRCESDRILIFDTT